MKYSVKRKVIKYHNNKNKLLEILNECAKNECVSEKEKNYIISIFNEVWQNWNQIFRTYWLASYYGGEDLLGIIRSNSLQIANFSKSHVEAEAIKEILRTNSNVPFFQEPTWGTTRELSRISNTYSSINRNNMIGASLSQYGDYIDDFQKIRNTLIHLNEASYVALKGYLVRRNYHTPKLYFPHNHPINFLFNTIGLSTDSAYESIFDNLDNIIKYIFL